MIRTAELSEKVAVAGDVYALLATGEETGGAYALIEARVPPGGGPPPHTQRDLELFYVMSGEVTFSLAGSELTAGPGSYLRVEPGVLHAFRNKSAIPATMLIQTFPAGLDGYFREVGQPVQSMDDHRESTQEEIENLRLIAPKYGIQIHPPSEATNSSDNRAS